MECILVHVRHTSERGGGGIIGQESAKNIAVRVKLVTQTEFSASAGTPPVLWSADLGNA